MPAPTEEFRVETGDELAQIYTHISLDAVNTVCSQWIGRPLDTPVNLEHRPFSRELSALWNPVVWSLDELMQSDEPPEIALHNLTEYAISLILQMHPHNYSEYLGGRETLSDVDLRRAQSYMMQNADRPLTPTEVARSIGTSTRALHYSFCENLGMPPRAVLYWVRMEYSRKGFIRDADAHSPADIARRYGFIFLGRFSRRYRMRYGEFPAETYARARGVGMGNQSGSSACLSPAKIELLRHHIDKALDRPISVDELSKLVGMSRQSFTTAFRNSFETTPGQYIISERLKWAQWLLTHGDESIARIAAETGFSSQAHLTTALRKHYGVTPAQVRKKY